MHVRNKSNLLRDAMHAPGPPRRPRQQQLASGVYAIGDLYQTIGGDGVLSYNAGVGPYVCLCVHQGPCRAMPHSTAFVSVEQHTERGGVCKDYSVGDYICEAHLGDRARCTSSHRFGDW